MWDDEDARAVDFIGRVEFAGRYEEKTDQLRGPTVEEDVEKPRADDARGRRMSAGRTL